MEYTIASSEPNVPILSVDKDYSTYNITFHNNKNEMIGKLDWSSGKFIFTGEAEESAKIFFNFIKKYSNDHILNSK